MVDQLGLDPAALPNIVERKGSLYLRSDHMKYGKNTLNSNWHCDREAHPKDYDISNPAHGKQNLLRATYKRIGNLSSDESSFKTTTFESTNERETHKKVYQQQINQKPMIVQSNFTMAMSLYNDDGGCLPRYDPDHLKQHLETTHRIDYTSNYKPTTKNETSDEPEKRFGRVLSEFTDGAGHKRKGIKVWQDC